MTIKKLYEKYQGKVLEDWGVYCSDDFKRFASDFRSVIRGVAKETGAELVKFRTGHYDFSGFLQKGDQFVYFRYESARGRPVDLNRSDPMDGILYRVAANERDYAGGKNHFTNINCLGGKLTSMFKREAA